MGRPKLEKFAALATMANVIEKNPQHKGKWASEFFHNKQPIILELACGKGDYARGLAKVFPEKNFLGVDIKGNRLFTAATCATAAGLSNVAFIREQIDHLAEYFAPGEISEIWITFPDPFLKKSKARKRLTSPKFLEVYQHFLAPGGYIHLKTDSEELYLFTKEVIAQLQLPLFKDYPDVYALGKQNTELFGIQTYYEQMHLADGRTIRYLCFGLKPAAQG